MATTEAHSRHRIGAVAGIDGCPAGWVAVVWHENKIATRVAADWGELDLTQAVSIAVDMPIGLPETGRRACDSQARARLAPPRNRSVFPAPSRGMLAAFRRGAAWAEANAGAKAAEGRGIQRQIWNLLPRIAELDAALAGGGDARVVESHPELVFQRLAGTAPVPRKTAPAGRTRRCELLRAAGMPDPAPLLDVYPRQRVRPDDILDACACALTAARIRAGTAERVPAGDPPRDAAGLPMAIRF